MQTTSPIILLVGQAGSGKDTVASFIAKNHNGVAIAQADHMKRLGKLVFNFSEDQLWGPSESRNAPDHRYDAMKAWEGAWERLSGPEVESWFLQLLGSSASAAAFSALKDWMNVLQTQTFWRGKTLTPRIMLQTLGTEWGRAQGKDLWSNYTLNVAKALLAGGHVYDRQQGLCEPKAGTSFQEPALVVITDGRFRNEVLNVLYVGGAVIKIESPTADGSAAEAAGVKGHASEQEQKSIPQHFYTHVFINDKKYGLEACEWAVNEMISSEFTIGRINYGNFTIGSAP